MLSLLRIRQNYNLDLKIKISKIRINIAIDTYGREGLYVSFSGGKDSTVLHHLVKEVEIERFGNVTIPRVFCDTGLEFPELKQFAKKIADIIIRPNMSFKQVLENYGYPVISKTQSMAIRKLTTQNLSDKYRNKLLCGDERGSAGKLSNKWHYLLDAPFKISEQCCDIMKKRPFHKYEKYTDRIAITGVMASESYNREIRYVKDGGCNAFNTKNPQSKPLSVWNTEDILQYVLDNSISIAPVYGQIISENGHLKTTGEQRTGCVFCAYGVNLEKNPNRFQRLKITHPRLYSYCMNDLNMNEVLEYLRVDH